jgi:DeoR/GlpR family transcriptional regulator of sugar metabolism
MQEQRIRIIAKLLHQRSYATIDELAQFLGVSTSTVRRDLAELARRNLVIKGRNGALFASGSHRDAFVGLRSNVNVREKTLIAQAAANLVKNSSVIYLDSSSTVQYMAEALMQKVDLTVVTNSLIMLSRLRGGSVHLYLIGGEFASKSHSCVGDIAEESLNHYHFDYAFFSSVVITKDGFAAETTESSASIRREVMQHSQCNVLLCDHSKIDQTRPFSFARIDDMDYIITDDPVRPEHCRCEVVRVSLTEKEKAK